MADTPKHSVSVAGIVVDDQDRVLVIRRRDNGHWEPPGGVLELDESPERGVVREVFEETGYKVEPLILTGVYKNVSRGVVALVFRCKLSGGQAELSSETDEVAWKPVDEARKAMSPAYSVRIDDALDKRGAASRTHDGVRLVEQDSPRTSRSVWGDAPSPAST